MRRPIALTIALAAAFASACAAGPSNGAAIESADSILASATPAPGSTVTSAPDSLILHFNPPARLDEVTVTGPNGTMPMMVHSVGEVADYDLPLPSLDAGSYSVKWKATAGQSHHEGRFTFTVAR